MSNKIPFDVIYNGGTESYYSCTSPIGLIFGAKYKVIGVDDRGFQTNYMLEGIDGYFNSVWFNPANEKPTYLAVSRYAPEVDKSYRCCKMEIKQPGPVLVKTTTSKVRSVEKISKSIYKVETLNSIYVVQISTN